MTHSGTVHDASTRQHIIEGLTSLARVMVGMTAQTLATLDVDITLSQYRTLVVLASRGPQRTVDLAAELGVHPSTVTRTCDRLIRRGLVQRRHRQQDRRVAWLGLTEQGKELVGEAMRRRAAEIQRLVDAVTVHDCVPVARYLNDLVVAAGEVVGLEWWERWSRSSDFG